MALFSLDKQYKSNTVLAPLRGTKIRDFFPVYILKSKCVFKMEQYGCENKAKICRNKMCLFDIKRGIKN